MSTSVLLLMLAGLLVLSALIAASETSFFSLRPWRVDRLRRERPHAGRIVADALKDPRTLLVSLIIGTELVNISASNLVAILRRRYEAHLPPESISLIAGMAVTSIMIILVCDLVPKSVAVTFPESVALLLARPLRLFLMVVRPVAAPLARLSAMVTEPGRARRQAGQAPAPLSEEDFMTLIDISRGEGILKSGQTEMIEAAFRLGDLQVRQVMVPRPDIIAIRETATMEEALELTRKGRHSRIPVYRESLDDITGVLYAKDLLARRFGLAQPSEVRGLMRPAVFVPEVMRARQLVGELQSRHVHLAIVVDEYGGTAGVVTMEDLLEELVGEFADEFERPIRVFRRLRRGAFWVRASMALPEFSRKVRGRIKDPEVDTVGGYVLKLFDRVPAEGDSVSDGQFNFTVRRMKGRRILVLLVERRGAGDVSAGEGGEGGDRPGSREASRKNK